MAELSGVGDFIKGTVVKVEGRLVTVWVDEDTDNPRAGELVTLEIHR